VAPTRPRAVVLALDLDGTLIDARVRQVGVAVEAVRWAGAGELDETRFWRAKRSGATTRGALHALGYDRDVAERAARRWGERIETEEWLARDRALPGVRGVLARLRAGGQELAVITARRNVAGAGMSLRAAGLHESVEHLHVVDPGSAASAKAAVLRQLGHPPFVGDTESDAEASRLAGSRFIAVATGQRSRGYLSRHGCTVMGTLAGAVRALALARPTSAA
jgi:phosphoglycolate phosphatase-like HAD superfamily hydrolase